jgi:hypothetical protein
VVHSRRLSSGLAWVERGDHERVGLGDPAGDAAAGQIVAAVALALGDPT